MLGLQALHHGGLDGQRMLQYRRQAVGRGFALGMAAEVERPGQPQRGQRGLVGGGQLAQVLNVTCPSMLLPYAREAIDSTLIKGSFPPLMIPPINFESLFTNALKQAADAQKSKTEANTH